MDDMVQAEKKEQKDTEANGCCGSTPGLQIMETIPVQKSSEKPCCGGPPGETTLSDNAGAAGTAASSVATKSSAFWIWGFSGLVGITLLVFSAGIVPGLKPEVFWRHILSNLAFVGKNIWSILPFFLLSVCISAWVTVSGFADRIKAVFNRREKIAIAGAAIVGATIPLCSCGVIPLIAALLASGVPLGPVMAFWISSPLMSPSMFVLTGGVLALVAVIRGFIKKEVVSGFFYAMWIMVFALFLISMQGEGVEAGDPFTYILFGVSLIGVGIVEFVPLQPIRHGQQVLKGEALLAGVQVGDVAIGKEVDQFLIDVLQKPLVQGDADQHRAYTLGRRLKVMLPFGAVAVAVFLKDDVAMAHDQDRVVGKARALPAPVDEGHHLLQRGWIHPLLVGRG